MISDKRILHVIEGLTMGELSPKDGNWKEMIDVIWKFSHLASKCQNQHEDWREEFLKCERELIDGGIIGEIK